MSANETTGAVEGNVLSLLVPVPEGELDCDSHQGQPEIHIEGRQLHDLSEEALNAIRLANVVPSIFQRSGCLVRLRAEHGPGGPTVEAFNVNSLRGALSRSATWSVANRGGGPARKGAYPPVEVVNDLLAMPGFDEDAIPPLRGITEVPIFWGEGTRVDQPGYHPASGLFYAPSPGLVIPAVPEAPSPARILLARHQLVDSLMADFPFADQASRANALALLLLPFVRPLIDGPTPLHLIEAARIGTGKGLLTDIIHMIAAGTPASPSAEVSDGDEWRKRIFAALLDGPTFLIIDNINGYLDSGSLASTLTARSITDRMLNTSKMVQVPVRCVWIGTGNNVRMSPELARRTPLIRLVTPVDRPWTRPTSGFRRSDLLNTASYHRGKLIHAALTLCQAWVAAGKPGGGVRVGSYEAWSRIMSGILNTSGVEGFMENAPSMMENSNDDDAKWTAMVAYRSHRFLEQVVGTSDLFPMVTEHDLLEGIIGEGNDASRKARLGKALARKRDACFGGFQIIAAGAASNGACLYRLRHLATGYRWSIRASETVGGGGRVDWVQPSVAAPTMQEVNNLTPITSVIYHRVHRVISTTAHHKKVRKHLPHRRQPRLLRPYAPYAHRPNALLQGTCDS